MFRSLPARGQIRDQGCSDGPTNLTAFGGLVVAPLAESLRSGILEAPGSKRHEERKEIMVRIFWGAPAILGSSISMLPITSYC